MEISDALQRKLDDLYDYLFKLESVLVCYSGGANSSLLLYAAKKVLGDKAEAIFFVSSIIPHSLEQEAVETAKLMNARLTVMPFPSLKSHEYYGNPENRCHLCKNGFLTKSENFAARFGLKAIIEGSAGEAPGIHCQNKIALTSMSVKSPFDELRITKSGIREISRALALSTWNKSPFFCLLTNFKHGEVIDEKMLLTVEMAEKFLQYHGFKYYIVWHDGKTAKLKLGAQETVAAIGKMRQKITSYFKSIGFESVYVVDYRLPKDMSEIKIY